jgi:hypothetical protein
MLNICLLLSLFVVFFRLMCMNVVTSSEKKHPKFGRVSWLNLVKESDIWSDIKRSQGRPRKTWSRNRHCLCQDVKRMTKMNKRKKKEGINLLGHCPACETNNRPAGQEIYMVYETRMFIALLAEVRHRCLSWASLICCTLRNIMRFILILSCSPAMCVRLLNGLLLSGFT